MRKLVRSLWRIISAPFQLLRWIARRFSGLGSDIAQSFRSFYAEEPEDTPVTDAFAKAVEHPQDLLYHLDALRKHLFRALLFLVITTGISFAFTRRILELLALPLDGGIDTLRAIDVTEPIGVFMRVALLTGFALALPYITLELWLFAAPGLRRRARFFGLAAIPAVTVFFLGGMAFAYFVMLDPALGILLDFMGFQTTPRPSTYFPFVTGLMFWVGLAFEFPLVIYILAALGFVRAEQLVKQARLAIVLMAIIAAAITPTVDPVNMGLVWGPLVLLYFLGVGLAFLAQGRRSEQETNVSKVSARS